MATIITQLKPAKHGKRMNGKRVIGTKLDRAKYGVSGLYTDDGKTYFKLHTLVGEMHLLKAEWKIEEIISRLED